MKERVEWRQENQDPGKSEFSYLLGSSMMKLTVKTGFSPGKMNTEPATYPGPW